MRQRRYNGYRGGRVTGRDIARLMLALLVIVLVLGAAGLLIGQRYLIYTDEGVRLELPFFHRETAAASTSVSAQVVQLPRPEPEMSAEAVQPESGEPQP